MWSDSKYSPIKKKSLRFPLPSTRMRNSHSSSVVAAHASPTSSSAGYKYSFKRVLEWATLQLPVSGLKRQVQDGSPGKADTISKVTKPLYEYWVGLACENWQSAFFSSQMCWTVSAFKYTKMLYKYIFGKSNKRRNKRNWKELHRPWGGENVQVRYFVPNWLRSKRVERKVEVKRGGRCWSSSTLVEKYWNVGINSGQLF